MADAKLPLSGVRVVEMSHMIMGPSCGMFLAFLGAEVIKVEPPGGDKTRHLTGMGRGFFPTFNRGKKSITLDLKADEGKAAFERLLETADVFVENFSDATVEKMGLSPDTLRARHPRLIIVSCKGFLHGPYQNRTAMDEIVQMMTGLAHMTGPAGRPLRIGSSANDIMSGLFGAYSALAALMARKESGAGHEIRVGLFENCLLLVAQHMAQFDIEGTEAPPLPEREFSWPVFDIFSSREGRQVFVGAATDGQWDRLCRLLALERLIDDPALQGRMARIEARGRILPLIAAAVAERPFKALVAGLEEAEIPYGPVSRPVEMYDDPHVNRPGGLVVSGLPEGGSFRAPGVPCEFDGRPMAPEAADLPAVGADTDAVLSVLGLDSEQIAAASGCERRTQ